MNRRSFLSATAAAACAPLLGCGRGAARASSGPHGGPRAYHSPGACHAARAAASSSSESRAATELHLRPLELIEAPSNLGLRPPAAGRQPGTWQAPEVLLEAGLARAVHFAHRAKLSRPPYAFDAQPGTRIRNGNTLRDFNLALADVVERSLHRGACPVVLGGDCSNLLGSLVGLRRSGGRGVVHVDGHSDFIHPGNFDLRGVLSTAAGMDLALATGRGEPVLTKWPGLAGPLVADADAIQIGERDSEDPQYYKDIAETQMERLTIQWVQANGIAAAAARIVRRLEERGLDRAWMHVDLDVLDERVMPAVDSPGRPGLTYAELGQLLRELLGSGRVAGLDIAIYDPELDPDRRYAAGIVEMLGAVFAERA